MQSYQLHIVSEHLKRRHPYLEPPFKARYDPTEVYKAVFDRSIPKLIEILLMQGLQTRRYTSALITLGQMASDQVQKSNMIQQGVVGLASAYLHCKVISIRRQAVILLGLLVCTPHGLNKLSSQAFEGIKKLLFDDVLQVRFAVIWCLCRICLSRLGTQLLCWETITPVIIQSFLKYSAVPSQQQQYVVIYLLQCFLHLLAYDMGIQSALGTGFTAQLKKLTATQQYSQNCNTTVHYLSLGVLTKIAMNNVGKNQCVEEDIIRCTQHFLSSDIPQLIANQVTLIMFISVHLTGKKQCIYNQNCQIETTIVLKLIQLLSKSSEIVSLTVKNDVKETLKIIAQQNDAFTTIVEYMCRQCPIDFLQDIFGGKVIVPLSKLLPSPNELTEPPMLPSNKINYYKSYTKTINHFINKQSSQEASALQIALEECVDLCDKLIMFLCYRGDKILQQGSATAITKLIGRHNYSRETILSFLQKYENVEHKITKTSLKKQIEQFPILKQKLGL